MKNNVDILGWGQRHQQSYVSSRGKNILGLVAIAVLIFVAYAFIQRRRRHIDDQAFGAKYGCQPMEGVIPYRWPFALDILKRQWDVLPEQRLLLFQSQYFDSIGPNMTFRLFGNQGYLTADPKNVESILSTRFEDWSLGSRRPGLMPMLGEGIFTQDGRPWKHSRDTLRRQFVRIHQQDLSAFGQHIEGLVSDLRADRGLVDLQPHFFRFTLSTTTALIFGQSVFTLPADETAAFEKAFDYASYISAIRLRLADFEWVWKPKEFRKACSVVKKYAAHFVELALEDLRINGEKATERYPFIINLYHELQDPVLVRDQLVHVLIAGRDTTACLLSWTFFNLVRRPEALKRLREEVMAITEGDVVVTKAQISRMKYLRCVINETHRLYPQLPVNVRVAAKTTFLPSGGGPDGKSPVLIPKDTGVGYSVYHMHRLKSTYGEDANDFRPERWLEPEMENIGWGYMAFHGGPRLCLGKEFALTEASYAIIRILQTFPNIRLPPGTPVVPTGQEKQSLTIVVSSAEGCKVLLD